MFKTVLILANSIKHHGYCVAGKELTTKNWIRFVGDVGGKELSKEQIKYKNSYGEYPATVLKILKIEVTLNCPLPHQPENYLVAEAIWEQVAPFKFDEIPSNFLDSPLDLWGTTDRVDHNDIEQEKITISQSLYLVKVQINELCTQPNRRVVFYYNGILYDLACTDPNFDTINNAINNGQKAHNNILCISLGELFDATGCHHKIVAGIF